MILYVRMRAFAHGAIRQRQATILYPEGADGCDFYVVSRTGYNHNEKWVDKFSDLLMKTFIK
jgi:hypothetical protein